MPSDHRLRFAASGLVLACALTACGTDGERAVAEPTRSSAPTRAAQPSVTPDVTPSPTATPERTRAQRGVDVSHHQGEIAWQQVSRDRIDFAYLKTTEGSSFTDPRFDSNARAARRAGLRVGGYHYFTLCSPGAPQAEHFASVLEASPARTMPPAIDLELIGNCADPPPREDLLREVRAFMDVVEERTGGRMVVYVYPDLEAQYRLSTALDRRLWVRRIGDTPPEGDWWMWQRDDQAEVAGIDAPADLNLLAP
jgi:lysozyme